MRGRLGVTDQHDVVVRPAFAADGREIAPERAIDSQLVAGKLFGEHVFEEFCRPRLVELVEAGAREGFRICLHHPGRLADLVLVAVRDEDAVIGLLEEKCEGIERTRRTHPGELVRPQIDARFERFRVLRAGARVDAVSRYDQVRVAMRAGINLGLEFHLHAERAGAFLQQPQQRDARAAAEAVAPNAMHGILVMDLDVVPVSEIRRDRPVAFEVVFFEGLQRLVGEHDAEAERVVGPVALVDDEAHRRPRLLRQNREVESGRPPADDVDFHALLRHGRGNYFKLQIISLQGPGGA